MTEYRVLAGPSDLDRAVERIDAGAGPVAVDVERASGFRYSQRAYLIQLYRRESGVFLLDPLTIEDFTPLQQVLADQEWVFHAATQDLPSLRELGLDPARIFDTELAARLLGLERVGLAAVVQETLGIHLAKEHSAADWSTRPLPQSWLEYAALDVLHLVDVRDALADALSETDKTAIAAQEFDAARTRLPKPAPAEPWRRLSGLHTIRGRQNLAVARALWEAREAYAQQADTAPGRLVPDRALVAAIKAEPRSKQQLAALKEFTGRASRSQLDRWWAAIEQGRTATELPLERIPSDSLPPLRAWADRNPAADLRIKAAKPVVDEIAEELHMPAENLLTPEFLRRVAWDESVVDPDAVADALAALGARPWQIAHIARRVSEAFVQSAQNADEASATVS